VTVEAWTAGACETLAAHLPGDAVTWTTDAVCTHIVRVRALTPALTRAAGLSDTGGVVTDAIRAHQWGPCAVAAAHVSASARATAATVNAGLVEARAASSTASRESQRERDK